MIEQHNFLLYTAPDGAVKVDVCLKDETVWLSQKALAELFGMKVPAINRHLKNIFDSGELAERSVISILEITASDHKTYKTRYYNLDAIIAVGYRVNNYQATQFRIWATKTLREFTIKGFVMDDGELDGADEVDEFAEAVLVEVSAAVVLVEGALEGGVVALEQDHGVVDVLADARELGVGLQVGPAGLPGDPEDIGAEVLVAVLGVGALVVALAGEQLGVMLVEGVGDVLEEDQAEDDVLVFCRVHVVAELVGGEPELGLEAEVGAGVRGLPGAGLLRVRRFRRGARACGAREPRERGLMPGLGRGLAAEDPGDDRLFLLAGVVQVVGAADLLELLALELGQERLESIGAGWKQGRGLEHERPTLLICPTWAGSSPLLAEKILERFEAGVYRYFVTEGCVFRVMV
jgi:hypothetical protein